MRIIFDQVKSYATTTITVNRVVSEINSAQLDLSNHRIYFYAKEGVYSTARALTDSESNFILKNLYEKGHCNLTKHFEGINLVF